MKVSYKSIIWVIATIFIFVMSPARADLSAFKNDSERFAYATGVANGKQIVKEMTQGIEEEFFQKGITSNININKKQIIAGAKDALTLSDKQFDELIKSNIEELDKLHEEYLSNPDPDTFIKTNGDRLAYMGGMQLVVMLGEQAKKMTIHLSRFGIPFELNREQIVAGLQDGLMDQSKLSDDEIKSVIESFMQSMSEKAAVKQDEWAKEALANGMVFRENFAKESGVMKTSSGLLYRIDKPGEGDSAKEIGFIVVNYNGKLVDGTEFESSPANGDPAIFRLNEVIAGWSEGLQLIKKGGKITLVVPPELAYGTVMQANIPPNSTLIFDIELVDVNLKFENE